VDYQGNSNKEKTVVDKLKTVERAPQEKVVTGTVIVKDKTLGSRFKNVFFGGDLNTSAKYVAAEVLLPALRNLALDMLQKGGERLIFGDTAPRRRSIPTTYSSRVQYNNPAVVRRTQYLPDQPAERWVATTNKKSIDDIVVALKEDADVVVERVSDIVDQYEVVSVADVYEMLGLPSSHIDNKWGWTQLPHIELRQVREGWRLSFPPLEELS